MHRIRDFEPEARFARAVALVRMGSRADWDKRPDRCVLGHMTERLTPAHPTPTSLREVFGMDQGDYRHAGED